MDSSVTEDAEKGRSPRASTLSAPMSRRELLQATGAATLGALFASTGCEVLTGDDDTPEPLLRRLSKRFYAHGERHQTECYGTVLDPASDAAAYLRVRGARERLVYRPRREAVEADRRGPDSPQRRGRGHRGCLRSGDPSPLAGRASSARGVLVRPPAF